MTLRVIALFGLIVGFFSLFRISLLDFSGGIFNGILKKPENIRDAIMEERKTKKKSALRREIDEVTVILENTNRTELFPMLCTISLCLSCAGAAAAILLNNLFLVPVLSIGLLFLPFWYIRLTAVHYKKNLNAELETALSIVTTAYLRTEDILTSVEENLSNLNPPAKNVFQDFVTRVKLVNPNVEEGLEELKEKINHDVFEEWVDAIKACQYDRSLKSTLVPIVTKLSDMRIVNSELEYMVKDPRKEFLTMVALVLSNIPLMYFLNQSWYNTLMHTVIGKIMLAICGVAIFVSTAFVIKLTKPIEYRS